MTERNKLKVFLDLEDTIIVEWSNPRLVNAHALSRWMWDHRVTEVDIFSFAIWTDEDKVHFVESGMKDSIQDALGVKINTWMSVDEMCRVSTAHTMIRWTREDFMQLRGKHGAFIDVCKMLEQDCTCVLIDDVVPNETIIVHDSDLRIELIKIDFRRIHRWLT